MTSNSLAEYFELRLSAAPVFITENLVCLGEIPRVTAFEAVKPLGNIVTEHGKTPDFLMDDSALVYRSKTGLVIITGCSHSGICIIVEYAKKVMNDERILDIIGGFHLLKPSKLQLSGTLEYLKGLYIAQGYACLPLHRSALKDRFGKCSISG